MEPEVSITDCSDLSFRLISIGDITVNERDRSITQADHTITLTDLSWRFLSALIEAAPAPASPARLCTQVWNSPHVTPETIAQRVRQVRQALGDDPKSPRYIRTIRGGGYQLIPPVQMLSEPPAEESNGIPRPRRLPALLMTGLLVLVGGAVVRYQYPSVPEISGASPQITELLRRAGEYRRRGSAEANAIAIDLYEQALAQAPDEVGALVGLSLSLSHQPSKYELNPAVTERAASLADRALVLDPGNGSAWSARGLADDVRGRATSALQYYQRSLQFRPDNPSVISSMGYLKQVSGQLHEALQLEAQALAIAPPTFFADFQIANTLQLAGLTDAGDAWLQRAANLRPDNVFLLANQARRAIVRGAPQEALRLLATARRPRITHDFLRGLALAKSGQAERALAAFEAGQSLAETRGRHCLGCVAMLAYRAEPQGIILARKLLDSVKTTDHWPEYRVQLAMLAAALGDLPLATGYLTEAVSLGYLDRQWMAQLPVLEPLLKTREGLQLLEQISLNQNEQQRRIRNDESLHRLWIH